MTDNITRGIAATLAERFIERAEALGYKGVKRDTAALDYFCGAATLAEVAGNPKLATHLGGLCALIVAVRGYLGVKQIASEGWEGL